MHTADQLTGQAFARARCARSPGYRLDIDDVHGSSRIVAAAHTRCRPDVRSLRRIFTRVTLAALIGALVGCSDGIAEADVAFVVATLPSHFDSMRMYYTAPDNVAPVGGAARPATGLKQGCEAIIRTARGHAREVVILENGLPESFDLDAVRNSDGWTVTSDGLAPPSGNPVAFRTQFMSCVSAIEDKFRAEPEKAPFTATSVTQ